VSSTQRLHWFIAGNSAYSFTDSDWP